MVGDPAACVSPPFDQFNPALVAQLEAQSVYNVARLVAAPPGGGPDESGDSYREKAALLDDWIAAKALTPDASPGIYPYTQKYTRSGQRLTRRGFIAVGDLRDAAILPHEATHAHVREDRARLRRATAVDFGLIFVVYSDPTGEIDRILRDCEATECLVEAEQPDGSLHELRRCTDTHRIERVVRSLRDLDCVIADGHHRTAAAFDAWREVGEERWAAIMMAFFNADAPGVTVLPLHRGVECPAGWKFDVFLDRLAEFFEVIRFNVGDAAPRDVAEILEEHIRERAKQGNIAFGMVGPPPDAAYLVEAPASPSADWPFPDAMHPVVRGMPTALFETGVLRGALHFEDFQVDRGDRLRFRKDATDLVMEVREGQYQLGFLLPPTPLDAVFEVARLRQNLPQKSTYFFPKLLTGLTVHRIEAGQAD